MGPLIALLSFFVLVGGDPTAVGSLGKISGKHDSVFGVEIEAFLGIPYARPPVGELRFSLPQPFGAVGNLNATKYGSHCMQTSYFDEHSTYGDEDCLFLNVYRKSGTATKDKKAVSRDARYYSRRRF